MGAAPNPPSSNGKFLFAKLKRTDVSGSTLSMNNFRKEQRTLPAIFIREFIQNTLDNRIYHSASGEHQKAVIKIRLITKDEIDTDFNKKVIKSVERQLKASNGHQVSFDYKNPSALVLEEFNTKGMKGAVDDSFADGDWAAFWHGEGKESKSGAMNGRAGQGKVTYNMISNSKILFGLTNRHGETKRFLMGKCVLPKTFELDGTQYSQRGFWSDWKDIGDDDWQPIPFETDDLLNEFSDAYCLQRKAGESGTSFVIPAPIDDVTENILITGVIQDFFFSIVRDRLEVWVGDTHIDESNLKELAEKHLGKDDALSIGYLGFLQDAVTMPEEDRVDIPEEWQKHTRFPEKLIKEDDIESIREKFEIGEMITTRFPIKISKRGGTIENSYFDVYLKSPEDLKRTEEAFIRSDLYIAKEKRLKDRPGKAYGLVIAEHELIAEFLADAEEASHLEFNSAEQKVQNNYANVPRTLNNIRNAMPRLYDFILNREEVISEDLLVGLLSISAVDKKKRKKSTGSGNIKGKTSTGGKGKKKAPIYLSITDGKGINIRPGKDKLNKDILPVAGRLIAAYKSVSGMGNPFKNFHPFDFDFSDSHAMPITTKNVTVNVADMNEIEFEITDPDFELSVSGFSGDYRVVVKAGVEL